MTQSPEILTLPWACATLCGSIDQWDQSFVDDDRMSDGSCLTCVTYATSDVTIRIHCEDAL